MKLITKTQRFSDVEVRAQFYTGRAGGTGVNAFVGANVFVYHHVGERPSIIVQCGGDAYSAAQARNKAACLLAAAEWIEANVRNVIRKAPKPQRKGGGR